MLMLSPRANSLVQRGGRGVFEYKEERTVASGRKTTRQLKNKKVIQLSTKTLFFKMSHRINEGITWSMWNFILSSLGNKGQTTRLYRLCTLSQIRSFYPNK